MMPINLNLMSASKKAKAEQVVQFLFVKNILEFCILVVAAIAISLTLSWLTLEDQFSNLSSSALLVNKNFSSYNQEIRQINKLTRDVFLAGKDYKPVYPKLREIIKLIPNDIKLNYLNIDIGSKKMVIAGTAKTRETLLNFEENLRKIPWIEKLETPDSELFLKENINFELNLAIKNL